MKEGVLKLRLLKEIPIVKPLMLIISVKNVQKELSSIPLEFASLLILHVWAMIQLMDSVLLAMLATSYPLAEVVSKPRLKKETPIAKLSTTTSAPNVPKEPSSTLREYALLLTHHVSPLTKEMDHVPHAIPDTK